MIQKIVGIAIALLIVALILPMGLEQIGGVDQAQPIDTSETLGTGNGTTVDFGGTLSNTPVLPETLVVTATINGTVTTFTTEDSELAVTDADAGTYTLTFSTAPDDGTTVSADYDYTVDIDDASYSLLTVLLPILAVVGVILGFLRKQNA